MRESDLWLFARAPVDASAIDLGISRLRRLLEIMSSTASAATEDRDIATAANRIDAMAAAGAELCQSLIHSASDLDDANTLQRIDQTLTAALEHVPPELAGQLAAAQSDFRRLLSSAGGDQ